MKEIKYSVLMSLYNGEKSEFFKESMESMLNQTYRADEIVIVIDGQINQQLEDVIDYYANSFEIVKIHRLENNMGLGIALSEGVKVCRNEWICRMDTDDISRPDRCEKQIEFLSIHPELDILGSNYYEFYLERNTKIIRKCPETNEEVIKFAKRRNPFGHCCLFVKKSKILEAGNYRDYRLIEDYDLWIRMFMNGCVAYNMQECLVNVRADENYYNRRGGKEYKKSIIKFLREYRDKGWYSNWDFFITATIRMIVYSLSGIHREFVYMHFLRRRNEEKN